MFQMFPSSRTIKLLLLIIFINGFLKTQGIAQETRPPNPLEKRITIKINNLTIKDALDKVAALAFVQIIYSSSKELTKNKITINAKNQTIALIFKSMLRGTTLTATIIDGKIVIGHGPASEPSGSKNQGPSVDIKGSVTDLTGISLPGAILQIIGLPKTYISDAQGRFAFAVDLPATIKMSYIGYIGQEITLTTANDHLAIRMTPDNSKLTEVNIVSTGYQTLSAEKTTGAFVQLDSAILNRRVSTDILSRLEGVVPGLIFNHNTINAVNGSTDISIRGHSTLFANDQPLVVLDNFPYDGDIGNVNPNDIESITILKDAAAASIWGVRSGNGVIVITSKKGKFNQQLAVDLNANITVGNKPDAFYNPAFLDSNDFINYEESLFNMGYYSSNITSPTHQVISPVVQILANQQAGLTSAPGATAQIDALWNIDVRNDIEKYLYRKSIDQQYNLNLRGGSNKSTYFFSAGYDNDLSNQVGNNNNRLTINSQNTFKPVKNLELSVGMNYTETHSTLDAINNLTSGGTSATVLPYTQLADANGNALPIVKDFNYSWITDPTAQKGLLNWQYKPLDEIHNADNTSAQKDTRINTGIKYSFLKDFSVEINYQYETAENKGSDYYSQDTYYARNLINRYTTISGTTVTNNIPVAGIQQISDADLSSNRLRGQLNFNHNWGGQHKLILLGGEELSSSVSSSNSNTAYGYDNSLGTTQNVSFITTYPLLPSGSGSALIPNSLSFTKTTDNYISYFSNAAYTYANKYTFSLSGRIDKSNLFGVNSNQNSVPLYSLGGSWEADKESFYHFNFLPYLRLRATFGYNGNVDKAVSAVTTIRQFSNSTFYGLTYAQIVNPGNPDLRWEKDRMVNLAVDFGSAKHVLSGSVDYFIKKGIDLFGDSPLAPSEGLTTFRGNTADTRGYGLDFVLNSNNITIGDFKWESSFQLSYVLDKVTQYNVTQTTANAVIYGAGNGGTLLPILNQPIFAIYSYKWAGLNHNTGNPQGYLNGQVSTDYNNITANTKLGDLIYNGPSRPTTFGSFRNTFTHGNLALTFNIIYKLNYYFRRSSISYGSLATGWLGNADFTRRWQKPGDELTTNVPSIAYPPYNSNEDTFYQNSSVLVDKGDHIRIQDASLSYDLTKRQWKRMHFNHLQFYGYVNNIGILWRANHDHLDPDLFGYSGAYPAPRTFSIGIKTNF